MPSSIEVHHWPVPRFSVFLSHSAEDRERLIDPVYEKLTNERIIPWYDQRHYPDGFEPMDALQENILKCHHIVYFITASSVKQGRGWNAAERTLASRINKHFHIASMRLHNFELPLFFVPFDHMATARSVWNPLRQYGPTCNFRVGSEKSIEWAFERIRRFLNDQFYYRMSAMRIANSRPQIEQQITNYSGLDTWLNCQTYLPRPIDQT